MVVRCKIIAKIQYDLESAEKYDFLELALSCVKLSFLERVTHDYQSDGSSSQGLLLKDTTLRGQRRKTGPEFEHSTWDQNQGLPKFYSMPESFRKRIT